jgi:uncharacterized membrane protein
MTLSRPLLIGLIVSAALNVFLIGGVAGVLWVRQTTPPAPAPVAAPVYPPSLLPESAEPLAPRSPLPPPPRREPPTTAAKGEPGERAPLWSAGRGLSEQSRQALRQTLREANRRNLPIIRQARGERQAALQALRSTAYDPAEAGKRLAAARALDIQARGNVETALTNYAATLSPAERAVLADGLARVYGPRARAPAR